MTDQALERAITISIHASRGGSDTCPFSTVGVDFTFQSTLPAGEATTGRLGFYIMKSISIHASRGGSDATKQDQAEIVWDISIHASRGGSDCGGALQSRPGQNFNPRFPRGKRLAARFSSGTTERNFNPRFPRGKRLTLQMVPVLMGKFQSTLPAGEATYLMIHKPSCYMISIHASRGGSDETGAGGSGASGDFNPRFPRGKRPFFSRRYLLPAISIHASRGGSDTAGTMPLMARGLFQSTLPAGEATWGIVAKVATDKISIHASRGGSDAIIRPWRM